MGTRHSPALVRIGKLSRGLLPDGWQEAARHTDALTRTRSTLEGLIKLAKALHVSLNDLVFDADERSRVQPRPRLLFEAIERLDQKEQAVIQELLEGMIVKYEARRWTVAG